MMDIVRNISYKEGFGKKEKSSRELNIAMDADRLDAIGSIGVARAYHYGELKGRKI